jgi:hypothetical protein
MKIRNILLSTVAVAAVAAPVVAVSAPANASGTPGCVTKTEYSKVKKGMSPTRVAQIFGTKGTVSYSYIGTYVFDLEREYKPCSPFNQMSDVSVDFGKNHRSDPWKVDGKSAIWIHNFNW